MTRQAIVVAVAGVGIAAGLVAVHVVRTAPDYSFAGRSAGGVAALLAAGWALIAAGLAFSMRRGRLAPLLVCAGLAWFVLEWKNPGAGSAFVFTAGLCLYAAPPALAGHAVLAYPGGRLASQLERIAVVAAYAGAVVVLGVLPALLFDPRAHGCNAPCPHNLVLVADGGRTSADVVRVGLYLGVAWASALALLALARLRTGWKPGSLVHAVGAVYLALVAALFAASLSRGFLWNGTLGRRLWLGEAAALLVLAVALAYDLLRVPRARAAVAQLVVDLARSPPPGGLERSLADTVGDPRLMVAYPVGDGGALVDVHGRPVELPADLQRTNLTRGGATVAVLAHTRGLFDDSHLVDEVTAAARLALENERLQAALAVRIDELRASRARIVAAGDGERKRLERDLHDGAQQRLVALSLSLRMVRAKRASPELDEAEAELERAIAELRDLAHGIFPAVLADGGFAVAVRALAEEGPVPIAIGGLPKERFPAPVETAAYAVVAEAARTASGRVLVSAAATRGRLVVDVDAQQDGRALDRVALEDRLGALDGTLHVAPQGDGRVAIHAELPCAS